MDDQTILMISFVCFVAGIFAIIMWYFSRAPRFPTGPEIDHARMMSQREQTAWEEENGLVPSAMVEEFANAVSEDSREVAQDVRNLSRLATYRKRRTAWNSSNVDHRIKFPRKGDAPFFDRP